MSTVNYSASKVDLFYPARSNHFFPSGVPESEAVLCAEMSRLAYCRPEPAFQFDRQQILTVLEPLGFTCSFFEHLVTPDGMGTHALLAVHDDPDPSRKIAVVSFRGTDASDPTDLGDDARFLQIPWSRGGFVHRGFAEALEPLSKNILDAFDDFRGRVLFTGHSLGAAMATLLASAKHPDFLYTFGSPRVGDDGFVSTLIGVSNRRFVDCSDIVTRIPPECLADLKYTHYGEPYYINRTRQVIENPPSDAIEEDRIAAASEYLVEYAWKTGNLAVRELADHAPINYVNATAADNSQPQLASWTFAVAGNRSK